MTDNFRALADMEFQKYLCQYFDDYDNDGYKKLADNYPTLWGDFFYAIRPNFKRFVQN
ncbi:MAG: hypothetical protein FWG90_01045 [Oscillospiraceae bacterium]|nr:hypothetical protein [Oscillospiraceae bacterium]